MAGHHRPLTGVINKDRNRASYVSISLNETVLNSLAYKFFASKHPHLVATNLSNERNCGSGTGGPNCNIRRTSTRKQHHLTEGVSPTQQF